MDLGGLSGGELLDHVDELARIQRETEVKILRAAVQHAVLNNPETSIPGWQLKLQRAGAGQAVRRRRARRRWRSSPPAELGARLGMSTYAARELIADALDLMHPAAAAVGAGSRRWR